jgi:hypothetical protein
VAHVAIVKGAAAELTHMTVLQTTSRQQLQGQESRQNTLLLFSRLPTKD